MATLLSIQTGAARTDQRRSILTAICKQPLTGVVQVAAMGFAGASKAMAQQGQCGFDLAVQQGGRLSAGECFVLVPGPRRLRITEAFNAKMFKHLR